MRVREQFPGLYELPTRCWLWCLQIPTRRRVAGLVGSENAVWLEVGSGPRAGQNGWTTLDLAPGCDLIWDLRRGIPFPDASIEKIYSSHFLEHLTFVEGQAFLAECRRALAIGGELSVCVPDASIYIRAYANDSELAGEYLGWKPALNATTRIDYVNYIAYMAGEHNYMFDQENLVDVLVKGGFPAAEARGFDPELDLAERERESVYARAVR